MPNKAIAGKISSIAKAESRSKASTKLAPKPKTKTSEQHASAELVSSRKKSRKSAETSTVLTLPNSRIKEAKGIATKPVEKPPKKSVQKRTLAVATFASNDAVITEAKRTKPSGAKLVPNSAKALQGPDARHEVAESIFKKARAPQTSEAPDPAPVAVLDTESTRPQVAICADSANASIKIFQIYYHERQSSFLDTDFEPYNNAGDSSPLLEFNVFAKLLQSTELQDVKLWGALSWNFWQKTGISGAQFKEVIAANPGYDVYFCNPHSEIETLYHNLWLQGEIAHPNFIPLCKELFEVADLPAELLTEIQSPHNFATSNYFVATPSFWKRYAAFVSRVLLAANKKLSSTARAILFSPTPDPSGIHAEASYIPFVIERLFSVFLRTDGNSFRAYKIFPQNTKGPANVHLKLLGEMRSLAYRTKSTWMASCWINYRNLYLTNIYGTPWANKYLKSITPQTITFAPDAENITCGELSK